MHPHLLTHPRIESYNFFVFLAFLLVWASARINATSINLQSRHVDNSTLVAVFFCCIGGRLFSNLFDKQNPISLLEAVAVWKPGGLSIYGAAMFGFTSLFVYSKLAKVNSRQILNVFSPSAAIGLAVGRIGCFFAGCCWGHVSKQYFGVCFPKGSLPYVQQIESKAISVSSTTSLPVHPTQLYEAAICFLIFFLLHRDLRISKGCRPVFFKLLIMYGFARWTIDIMRADTSRPLLGLTIAQMISVLAICLGLYGTISHLKQRTDNICVSDNTDGSN